MYNLMIIISFIVFLLNPDLFFLHFRIKIVIDLYSSCFNHNLNYLLIMMIEYAHDYQFIS